MLLKKETKINPCPICNGKIEIQNYNFSLCECTNCKYQKTIYKSNIKDVIKDWNEYTNNWLENTVKEINDIYTYNAAIRFATKNNYNNFKQIADLKMYVKDHFLFITYGDNYSKAAILQVYSFTEDIFSKSLSNIVDFLSNKNAFTLVFDSKNNLAINGFEVKGTFKDELQKIFYDILAYYVQHEKEQKRLELKK